MDFGRLSLRGRFADLPLDRHAAAGGEPLDFALVIRQLAIGDDLDIGLTRTVVQLQKTEAPFGITAGAGPALQTDLAADCRRLTSGGNRDRFHEDAPS